MSDFEQRISEGEKRLQHAVEAAQLGTWEYYPLTGDLHWSPECRKIYGLWSDTEVNLSVFTDHIYPDDKEMVLKAIEDAMDPAGNGKYDITYRIIRFDNGKLRWIHPRGRVFFNESQQADRFIGTVVDITDYKIFEENLRESEQRARIAVEAAELGTFDWDLSTNSFYSSKRVLDIFGFPDRVSVPHTELIARIHPDDRAARDKAVNDSEIDGGLLYESRIILPGNNIRWVKVYGKVISGRNRELRRMYGIVMDITDQKSQESLLEKMVAERTLSLMQSNEDLKKSEERYSKMAEEVQDYAILLLSTEGYILNWNKGAERIKGYKESEIIGKNFRIFYLQEDRENKLPEKLLNLATVEGRASHEGWRIRKNNTIFWGSIVITALHDADNNIIGFSKVTRDLTERKIAEEQMQQYTKELESRNKELEQFAYITSHDLQEPLRKIQTFTEILEKNISKEAEARKYLEKISSSAQRMSQLVKSVLEYSRLSHPNQSFQQVDLNAVIENVKSDLELQIIERRVTIDCAKLPVTKGIGVQLHQLFLNLLGNAIKFSAKEPSITIRARKLKPKDVKDYPGLQPGMDYAEISVKDNGIGFEQKYASKIFTIFQRLHAQKDYPGTGIGLALCKKIVDNHYGHIRVESEPGKGTTFFLYLLDQGEMKEMN